MAGVFALALVVHGTTTLVAASAAGLPLTLPGEVRFVTGVIETVQPIDTEAGPTLAGSVRLASGQLVASQQRYRVVPLR